LSYRHEERRKGWVKTKKIFSERILPAFIISYMDFDFKSLMLTKTVLYDII